MKKFLTFVLMGLVFSLIWGCSKTATQVLQKTQLPVSPQPTYSLFTLAKYKDISVKSFNEALPKMALLNSSVIILDTIPGATEIKVGEDGSVELQDNLKDIQRIVPAFTSGNVVQILKWDNNGYPKLIDVKFDINDESFRLTFGRKESDSSFHLSGRGKIVLSDSTEYNVVVRTTKAYCVLAQKFTRTQKIQKDIKTAGGSSKSSNVPVIQTQPATIKQEQYDLN